jgi:hypothetical protein
MMVPVVGRLVVAVRPAQPKVRARLVVIQRIQSQDSSHMPFAEDQNMIQAVAPQRTE